MLSSLQRCWLGPCNGMHHLLCSAIWLSGNSACSSSTPLAPASSILPDWLLQNSSRQGLASGPWKALSWMSRVAGLPALQQARNTAVAKAFLHASNPQPRREALPFSLSFVCWLERRVMSADSSLADKYAAGCLHCAIWGSLRWADALWVAPSSIQVQLEQAAWLGYRPELRRPRRVCTGVLLGLTGSSSACWGLSFWSALSQILHQSRRADPDRIFDFLPALLSGSASAPTLLSPMHRPDAIPWIRSLLQEHWSSVSSLPLPAAYALVGVHSAKATLLFWARQLNLSESLRRIQGSQAGGVGVVCSPLWSGRYRSHAPAPAGHPQAHPFWVSASSATGLWAVPDFRVDFAASVIGSQLPSGLASSAGSESDLPGWDVIAHVDSSQDADQFSDQSPSPPPSPASKSDPDDEHLSLPWLRDDPEALEVEQVAVRKARRTRWDLSGDPVSKPPWLFNHRSGVLHAAVAALPGSERSVLVHWEGQQVPLRPACGAAVHQLGSESACQSVPVGCTLCLRKVCAAVFSLDTSR